MKIKKCPKCGTYPRTVIIRDAMPYHPFNGLGMMCDSCRLLTKPCKTRDEAVAKWNEFTNTIKGE